MEPLRPEGGHLALTYRAKLSLPAHALSPQHPSDRPISGAILYLLTPDAWGFSALHRLPTDEIYHFHLGDPIQMLLLHPNGTHQQITLGQDVMNGQQLQFNAPAGSWQGSRLIDGGEYALVGTTMAPAFMDSDYEHGIRAKLIEQYPAVAGEITALTRK